MVAVKPVIPVALAVQPVVMIKISPVVKSVIASVPLLTLNVSFPAPPVNESFPAPPVILSLPAPPTMISLPASPNIISFPLPPVRLSIPEPPVKVYNPAADAETLIVLPPEPEVKFAVPSFRVLLVAVKLFIPVALAVAPEPVSYTHLTLPTNREV